mgnify:CR=1 FL=1
MQSVNTVFDSYPGWYKVEKDTEKTIKKLASIKELMPYLKNPDEFIRRLAVLRINDLRLKDSIIALKELLDDPLETTKNKELAAWTIRLISLHWNIDLFITNKYLNKYSGKERYVDICKVSITDSLPSLKFNFSTSIVNSELQLGSNDLTSSKDMDFDLPFSVKEWFHQYSQEILEDLKRVLINLPFMIFKLIKTVVLFCFGAALGAIKFCISMLSGIIAARKNKTAQRISEALPSDHPSPEVDTVGFKHRYTGDVDLQRLRNSYSKSSHEISSFTDKQSPLEVFRNAVFNFFYVILSPVRLVRRNKKVFFAMLIAIYCFLAFTTQGKVILYRFTGIDLMEEQKKVYNTSREFFSYVWDEFEELINIKQSDVAQKEEILDTEPVMQQTQQLQYKVLAEKGLNLRKEPNAASARIAVLPYNSLVTYAGQSEDTPSGKWHKIITLDGKTGWASSNFLEQTGGIKNE